MRNSHALIPSVGPDPGPGPRDPLSHLLAELLALNEEMAEQLWLERLAGDGPADTLTSLIDQHEVTAQLLRDQLVSQESGHHLQP